MVGSPLFLEWSLVQYLCQLGEWIEWKKIIFGVIWVKTQTPTRIFVNFWEKGAGQLLNLGKNMYWQACKMFYRVRCIWRRGISSPPLIWCFDFKNRSVISEKTHFFEKWAGQLQNMRKMYTNTLLSTFIVFKHTWWHRISYLTLLWSLHFDNRSISFDVIMQLEWQKGQKWGWKGPKTQNCQFWSE